jgi:hypothetical protein
MRLSISPGGTTNSISLDFRSSGALSPLVVDASFVLFFAGSKVDESTRKSLCELDMLSLLLNESARRDALAPIDAKSSVSIASSSLFKSKSPLTELSSDDSERVGDISGFEEECVAEGGS